MTFAENLDSAKDTSDADSYISRVKAAVAAKLQDLDSSATIQDTNYFNHTAIPDFVVTWPKEKSKRGIFLRHSYDSFIAYDDIKHLAKLDPVVLSLNTHPPTKIEREDLNRRMGSSSHLLLTDPHAVDVISELEANGSPLLKLVRANFIRGGRGFIDQHRAAILTGLINLPSLTNQGESPPDDLVSESFTEDAATRITRTAQLISLAFNSNYPFSETVERPLIRGKLSATELRYLIPWLLKQRQAIANEDLWRHLGDLISFADIENIRSALLNLDLTPLVAANSKKWVAKWAYVGASLPADDDETYLRRSSFWSFQGSGAMGINIGNQRLSVAHNGQLASKTRDGATTSWDSVRGTLERDQLSRIDLRGITRSVILHAERSPDIRTDVRKVTDNLGDSYTVNEVALKTSAPNGEEGNSEIIVKFDNAIVQASSGASIFDLARICMQVLNFSSPSSDDQLASLFAPRGNTE
ncbi:hypothetical protein [Nocardiopsis protaetiae]|uniref:hypothetical protein n=1 Tax=Nocardiopsis protaetiae TaxID=3382270 RepID=UPI00387ADED9